MRWTIERLKNARESEDKVEPRGEILPMMEARAQNLQSAVVVFLGMLLHCATKMEGRLSLAWRISIPTKLLARRRA